MTRRQATAALSHRTFDRLVRHGGLVSVAPSVWRLPGAPRSWRGRVMAACLSVGDPVAASHTSAARLWDMQRVAPDAVHLTVPRGRSGRIGPVGQPAAQVVIHHGPLPPSGVTRRYDIPVTTVPRTLVDLAGVVPEELLGPIADDLERRHLLNLAALRRERLSRPRLPGIGDIDALIDRWSDHGGGPAADSKWEDEVYGWLVDAGLPIPRRQHQVILSTGRLVLIDLAYPVEQVAIEFDGFKYHRGRGQFDRDRDRLSDLAADGWTPILVTSTQPAGEVVDRVRRALERRGRHPSRSDVNLS